jgi:hypothetical protein
MNLALNGLPKSWEPFVKGVFTRENLPYLHILWDDCIHKETQEESKERKKGDEEEENLSLVIRTRNFKENVSNGNNEESTS